MAQDGREPAREQPQEVLVGFADVTQDPWLRRREAEGPVALPVDVDRHADVALEAELLVAGMTGFSVRVKLCKAFSAAYYCS